LKDPSAMASSMDSTSDGGTWPTPSRHAWAEVNPTSPQVLNGSPIKMVDRTRCDVGSACNLRRASTGSSSARTTWSGDSTMGITSAIAFCRISFVVSAWNVPSGMPFTTYENVCSVSRRAPSPVGACVMHGFVSTRRGDGVSPSEQPVATRRPLLV